MGKIDTEFSIRRFAFCIAGPRDFVINLLINGTIAWFVFRGERAVALAGDDTIFKMLLPMSFIETDLTSFFGFLGGTLELQKHAASPIRLRWGRWFVLAALASLLQAAVAFAFFATVRFILQSASVSATIPGDFVFAIVGLISGTLAYVMHSNAVIQSTRFIEFCKRSESA